MAQTDESIPTYEETPVGIVWNRPNRQPVRLTNFRARIVTETVVDDGAETSRFYDIEADVNGQHKAFEVPATKYDGMSWVAGEIGARAIVFPNSSGHARIAIQLISGDIPQRSVFSHMGWREVDGEWAYLHAGGAIGMSGPVPDVEVALGDPLSRYQLVHPESDDDLRNAVRASLRFLDIADDSITIPLYLAIWRAALGCADFGVYLSGKTGAGKTELAALIQQHWGPGLDARHLPGGWSGTENALEELAFLAKDAVLVIDDYVPTGHGDDALNAKADRVLRAQGNNSGRQRLTSDARIRPARPPRGLILSTGEVTPHGHSLRSRNLILEVSGDRVDWEGALTICQNDARNGLHAKAMSGFVKWLAKNYDAVSARLPEATRLLQNYFEPAGGHKRSVSIVANLLAALHYFLLFAEEVGAISSEETEVLKDRAGVALKHALELQSKHQAGSDPVAVYIDMLKTAIASGKAHLRNKSGRAPSNPGACGWSRSRDAGGVDEWRPCGEHIGWVDGDNAYLLPLPAYEVATKLASATGERIPLPEKTLKSRLRDNGMLLTDGGKRGTTVRQTVEGQRREVLHMALRTLVGQHAEGEENPASE